MNLKDYYREVEAQEAAIDTPYVLIISLKTANGGREGIESEVSRATAARLIVEKKARLATPEEAKHSRAEREERKRQKDLAALKERVQMTKLAEEELIALKKAMQQTRKGK